MLAGLRRMVIASIGPTTTETLEEFGLDARHHAQPSEDGFPGEGNRRAGRGDSGTQAGKRMPNETTSSRQFGKYYGLAFLIPSAILVGYGIGYGLDKFFGTTYLKMVFLFLGSCLRHARS